MNVLWIPGWSIPFDRWKELCSPFQKAELEGMFIDFRACQRREDFLQLVLDTIDGHQGEWLLAGWSMGSMIAIEAATLRKARVKGLFLLSSGLQFSQSDHHPGGIPLAVIRHMSRQLKRNRTDTLTSFYEQMFSESEKSHGLDQAFLQTLEAGDPFYHWQNESLIAGLDYLANVQLLQGWPTVSVPITWIHGSDDTICPSPASGLFSPSKRLIIVEGAGHVPFYTQDSVVINAWEELLGNVY
ncbi:alpha/beta hydrolase [Halalkalibacterium halodurans]|uniref:BH3908 protein n=1 Tax=Halalkalibacterium halodurans (strain ATCC BAA-125 / DSM 18197 / FERM 7344 / JCM 9153 / C-125) TaxID=272558 RepID=Q9K624_HALH5|nr:alpha/beta hydrolase [Halalkalibacterium halodurans]MED4172091.1 alpha/beta hydrolase [Halalkalibacterium halodurans]BAB07627.1 BH3908 [Halalkalibacterium halodurans C-125]